MFAQVALVSFISSIAHHVSHSRLVRVKPGHKTGTGGTATGRIVKLGVPEPVGCEAVKVLGPYLAPVASDVRISDIVGHDEDDVRAFGRFRPGAGKEYGQKYRQH
jgi:hypothetical protein